MVSDNLSAGVQILTMVIFSLVISFSRGWQLALTVLAMLPAFSMSIIIELYYEATLNTTVAESSETFAMGLFVNIRTSVTLMRFVVPDYCSEICLFALFIKTTCLHEDHMYMWQ